MPCIHFKMKPRRIDVALLIGSFCLFLVKADAIEASFYGESYIHQAFQDANQNVNIELEFLTVRPEGLLFLAVGQTDYMFVQLNAGIIELRANLGSGEAVVFSARGVRLDDSRWHAVKITCMQGVLYLQVDGMDQGQASTPGNFHDLNIDLGAYIGGKGNLKHSLFRGNTRSFRGCLRGVAFNSRDILSDAKSSKDANIVFQVSWYCDDEFSANSDLAISLNHETSFVAFPSWSIYSGSDGLFSCDLKTRSTNAILLFNSGTGSTSKDFIAVELVNGKPKLSINKGSGIIEVALQASINDGKWHTLMVSMSESTVKLQVDLEQNLTRFHIGSQNNLNLRNHLYIGGLSMKAHSQISELNGMIDSKTSLLGCVRNISMNSAMFGFQEVEVSRLIEVGCGWSFPCSHSPCIEMASCVEVGKKEFRCECDQASCVKNGSEQRTKYSSEHLGSILSVKDIVVPLGGSKVIDGDIIQVQDRYRNFFRRENVVFFVRGAPQRGIIELRNGARNQDSFTWSDLMKNMVLYRHTADSSKMDRIILEVSVHLPSSQNSGRNTYDFIIPVKITSQNLFEVSAPSGHVLGISSGGKLHITTSVLNVESDADPFLISFQIIYLRQAASYFELSSAPASPINSFTFHDIQMGYVWFQHKGDAMVYTKINVTDVRHQKMEVMQLRFREQNFEIKEVKNSGLLMGYGSTHLITSQNLSFLAGSKFEEVQVTYQITRSPNHGVLQLQTQNSYWNDVQNFTQQDIDSGRIRYHHFPDDSYANFDSFKFQVSSKEKVIQAQTFNIRFKSVVLSVERNDNLVIHKNSYSSMSNETLLVVSNAENLDFNNIVYFIIRAPDKGRLYVAKRPITNSADFDFLSPLKTDDSFSQMDVNRGLVYYKYNSPSIKRDTDYLDIQASYFGYTVMVRIIIQYSPGNLGVRLVNNGLRGVLEGSMKVISKQNLFIETNKYKNFTFTVIKSPSYGSLNLIDSKTSIVLQSRISSFITAQIVSGKLAYHHDDSEHDRDHFEFAATPNIRESNIDLPDEIEELTDTFPISIIMRNDNPPERVANKILHVITGQKKTITTQDLSFHDPDIDFDDSLLFYQRQRIPNGDILDRRSGEEIFNFTQRDLTEGRLVFKHSGDSFSRVPILVSDGQFFSSSILEIQASEPFFRVVGNLHLEVESGQRVTLDQENIAVESNLDFEPEDALFRLTNAPKFGTLQVNGNTNADFSLGDILKGFVKYHHWGKSSLSDTVDLIVMLKTFRSQAQLSIDIASLDTLGPPEIIHNQIFTVNVHQIQVITEQYLEAHHPGYQPKDINYIVTGLPQQGHLVIKGRPMKAGSAPEFSQEDINSGHVVYASDSPTHLNDKFTFDVGTEIESLRNIEFLIEVIPVTAIVTHINTTIPEGGSFTFNTSLFTQYNHMSSAGTIFFHVDQAPMHGRLIKSQGSQIKSFSSQDLQRKRISYIHDGSESRADMMTIKAVPQTPSSHPGEILMVVATVEPVDDQPPRIVVNSGLNLWSGSLALITGRQLQALDPDTASADIHYLVTTQPSNGHLAFLNNTFKPINSFTQLDLDSENLVFVHKGAEYGSFTVRVRDTRNQGGSASVHIRARPVTITMINMKLLHAFPYALQPITNQSLLAEVSASNFSHPIIFTLKNPKPLKGQLVTRVGHQIEEIKSFTQDEVNRGNVFYQHTSLMIDWKESDRLIFDVSTTYAPTLTNKVLNIDIAFININADNYQDLLQIEVVNVVEGKKAFISKNNFDSTEFVEKIQSFKPGTTVHFSFESFTRHGQLLYRDSGVELGQEFTQDDVNSGLLVYKHDHSDTLADEFFFGVKILVPRSRTEPDLSVAGLQFNFPLAVEPVNDGNFELVTLNPKITVLQGSEVVVTPHNLSTVDSDTGPEGIEYVIITQPGNGMLVLDSALTSRLQTFTQQDIDNLSVIFKHDNTPKTSSSLYFKVSDRRQPPTYANLDIIVHPLFIKVQEDLYIPLLQGSPSITLTPDHIVVQTNGDLSKVKYTILQTTRFGRLTKQGRPVSFFTQQDLEHGRIRYIQKSDSPGEDFFVMSLDLSYVDGAHSRVVCNFFQKPLVKLGPLVATGGAYVAITRASLDASELAELTNDDPQFRILKSPEYGQIMKRQRQRRQAGAGSSFKPVSEFTFEDVLYTRIYYVPARKANAASHDKFSYILSAKGVPPAKGELTIELEDNLSSGGKREETNVTHSDTRGEGNTKLGNDVEHKAEENEEKDTKEQGASLDPSRKGESEGESNKSIIIIVVVLIVCLLLVAAFTAALFIWWRRRGKKRSSKNVNPVARPRPLISGPLQLEQPNVFIQPKKNGNVDCDENDETSRALMISSPVDSHEGETIALVPSSSILGEGNSAPGKDGLYVNTAHLNENNQQETSHQNAASPDVTLVASGSKVRPGSESSVSEDTGDRRSAVTSGRGSSASGDLIDWALIDPDLLQSCNLSTPALRSNQYWL